MKYTLRKMLPLDWPEIRKRVPIKLVEDTQGIVARDESGDLAGAVVFDNFSYSSVQCHQVIVKPLLLRHGFFEEVCRHAYDTCGKHQIIGLVSSDDEKVLKFNKKIGFVETARIPNGHSIGIDTVVMTMTAEQCNFYSRELEYEQA